MKKIDFVILWVDGNDPKWQAEKNKYASACGANEKADTSENRYRDWDNLKYWFRGVEKFAPWVNRIYFVTYGHLPSWLDTSNPKLEIVNHKDFIPEEYLPAFNSRAIDFNLHRIKGLSEQFVYFNDDMFLIDDVKPSLFFKHGLPCDTAILNASSLGYGDAIAKTKTPLNRQFTAGAFDLIPINRNFDKRQQMLRYWYKWLSPKYGTSVFRTLLLFPFNLFPGFMNYHLPASSLKSNYEAVWANEFDLLDENCKKKFREPVMVNQWLFSYWQFVTGKFVPRSPKVGKLYSLTDNENNNKNIFEAVRNQKYKMICINDSYHGDDFNRVKDELNNAFEQILPEKSGFEL